MADDFSLQAVISADSTRFTSAMSAIADATREASTALRDQLTAGSQEASSGLESLQTKSEEAGNTIREQFDSIKESAAHLAETFAIFEGINILREQISQALEFGETIERLTVETGASSEFLQQLKFAATATGSSFDSVTAATRRLTEVYAQLRSGGGSPQLLGALSAAHINVSQLSSLQTGIEAISHAVQQFGANSEIARDAVVQLLGRGGLDFLPMLSQFDQLKQKAQETHAILGGSLIESLGSAEGALNTLGAVVEADAERFTAALAPAIKSTAGMLTDLASGVGKLEQGKGMENFSRSVTDGVFSMATALVRSEGDIEKWGDSVIQVFREVQGAIDFMKGGFLGLANGLPKAGATGGSAIDSGIAAQIAALQKAKADADAEITKMYGGGGKQPPPPPPPPPNNAGNLGQQAGASAKQAQEQALQAYQQQLQAYTEEQATEVALANNTAQAKVQATTNVYEKAVSLIGQTGAVTAAGYQKEVDAALKAGVEELNARREMLNQTKALAAEQINAAAAEQLQQLAVAKAALAEELAAHQITKAQELAAEQNLVSQTLAIELNKDSQLESLYAGDAQKFQEYQQQKVDAYFKAQQEMLENQTQTLAQQEQATQQAGTKMAADINQGLTLMTKYFETSGKQQQNIMREAFQEIVKDFQQKIAQMVAQWLESTALFKTFTGGEALGQGPHGAAGPGGGIIGGIGSVLSGTVGGPNGAGYSLTGGAIGGDPGLAGLGPSAFAPGQGVTPDMFTQPLTQAFQNSRGEITNLFSQGFQGASSVLHSIFGQAASGIGGAAGGAAGAAGGGTGQQTISLLTQMGGYLSQSVTHLATMAENTLTMIAQGAEQIAALIMLALKPSVLGTTAAGGAFVHSGFGTPVGDGMGGMVGIVHPGELILPASHVDQNTRMPNARSLNMPSMTAGAQQMSNGGGDGGGTTNHIEVHSNGHNYSALDSDGMSEVLDKHAGAISDAIMGHLGNHGGREKYR